MIPKYRKPRIGPKINWRLTSLIFNNCLIRIKQKEANNKKENSNLQLKTETELGLENSNQINNKVTRPRI